jgi:hypothetical protein
MKALYEARIGDLGPGDFVKVECICGHDVLMPSSGLQQGQKLPPYMPVLDLESRFRCRECDARGKAVVSIKWGESGARRQVPRLSSLYGLRWPAAASIRQPRR